MLTTFETSFIRDLKATRSQNKSGTFEIWKPAFGKLPKHVLNSQKITNCFPIASIFCLLKIHGQVFNC